MRFEKLALLLQKGCIAIFGRHLHHVSDKVVLQEARRTDQTHLDQIIPMDYLEFSDAGRFDEILQHIEGHKYYLNQNIEGEMNFSDAALSWYYNVFLPIIEQISNDGVISRFPGRTKADLYIWIVKYWDELKGTYGEQVTLRDATRDFSLARGKSLWQQFLALLKH